MKEAYGHLNGGAVYGHLNSGLGLWPPEGCISIIVEEGFMNDGEKRSLLCS